MRRMFYCGAALLALVTADLARAAERAQQVRWYGDDYLYCMALDSNEDIWVTNIAARWVAKIRVNEVTIPINPNVQPQLKSTVMIDQSTLTWPVGIAIDSNDNVYVADAAQLWKRYPDGTLVEVVKSDPHGIGSAWATIVDDDDNAYVAGLWGTGGLHGVWKVSPTEEVTLIGSWAPVNGANAHWDLMTDKWDNVFVSENVQNNRGRVFRWTSHGYSQKVITPGVTSIDGLEVDDAGNLWVVGDSVKKIVPNDPES